MRVGQCFSSVRLALTVALAGSWVGVLALPVGASTPPQPSLYQGQGATSSLPSLQLRCTHILLKTSPSLLAALKSFPLLTKERDARQGRVRCQRNFESFDDLCVNGSLFARGIEGGHAGFQPTTVIPQLTELDRPATTVTDWIAQIEASLIQIPGVRVETTEAGLQVILETPEGAIAPPEKRSLGNALIVDIPNATLAEEFSQANPINGIALVSITELPGDRVRVAITGSSSFTIRGFSVGQGNILRDGLPDPFAGTLTELSNVERIEVLRGPASVLNGYGNPGGSINVVTEQPLREPFYNVQGIIGIEERLIFQDP